MLKYLLICSLLISCHPEVKEKCISKCFDTSNICYSHCTAPVITESDEAYCSMNYSYDFTYCKMECVK